LNACSKWPANHCEMILSEVLSMVYIPFGQEWQNKFEIVGHVHRTSWIQHIRRHSGVGRNTT
jgi:hypothetical protein